MLGKSVTDLQSDIVVGTNAISGTLKYVTGYTGFSGDPNEQEGNYIVLHIDSNEADTLTVELIGGVSGRGEVTLDSDGLIIVRISNNAQILVVRAYKDGVVDNVQRFSLAGLTLLEE